jgi:hypothetical protein
MYRTFFCFLVKVLDILKYKKTWLTSFSKIYLAKYILHVWHQLADNESVVGSKIIFKIHCKIDRGNILKSPFINYIYIFLTIHPSSILKGRKCIFEFCTVCKFQFKVAILEKFFFLTDNPIKKYRLDFLYSLYAHLTILIIFVWKNKQLY